MKLWKFVDNYLARAVVADAESHDIFLDTHTLDPQVSLACKLLTEKHNTEVLAARELTPQTLVAQALREALEDQKRGAEWRRKNEPENWNGSDDEAFARLEQALALTPEAAAKELQALHSIAREAANLVSHETTDARARGKTPEGRTVTALVHELRTLNRILGLA